MQNTNTIFGEIAGNVLVGTGVFIDTTMNFVGDVAGDMVETADGVVDCAKKVASVVTNAIVDGARAAWDWISFWD